VVANVSTKAEKKGKRTSLKFALDIGELRRLNTDNYPALGRRGKYEAVGKNPHQGKDGQPVPYRFLDGTQGAPVGFGFYVGKRGASFEVAKRGPDGFRRFSLGSVMDMELDAAHELARTNLAVVRETGENPKAVGRRLALQGDRKNITLGGCFLAYIESLEARAKRGKIKAVSVEAVRNSLARLERPEVGLASEPVRGMPDAVVLGALDKVRRSAMVRSNRIPTEMRDKLAKIADWSVLSTAELAALGITGKYVQQVRAAGLAAAEHTLTDAIRAVEMVVEQEIRDAQKEGRKPVLFSNPLQLLYTKDVFRSAKEMRNHYRQAQVRNPLGSDDQTLPRVLKTIVARRDEQNGLNRGAADYLLLTLLFGSRRTENAVLKWFDRCTKGEIEQREVSWVWLAEPHEVNPITKRSGSQAYYFDTKSGEERFIPVCYFAERILRQRLAERRALESRIPAMTEAAEKELRDLRKKTIDSIKIAKADAKLAHAKGAMARLAWVFPARSRKARSGHYSDPKSILRNVRIDAGLLDLDKEIDIGLTPHDLRRTLGRYAGKLLQGNIVSQLLHHHLPSKHDEQMAKVSEIYTEQEWGELRRAMATVEEAMIASSPRVWNRLKDTDKPRLDEVNDPAPEIFKAKKKGLVDAPAAED
jgi:hypothetical protein